MCVYKRTYFDLILPKDFNFELFTTKSIFTNSLYAISYVDPKNICFVEKSGLVYLTENSTCHNNYPKEGAPLKNSTYLCYENSMINNLLWNQRDVSLIVKIKILEIRDLGTNPHVLFPLLKPNASSIRKINLKKKFVVERYLL